MIYSRYFISGASRTSLYVPPCSPPPPPRSCRIVAVSIKRFSKALFPLLVAFLSLSIVRANPAVAACGLLAGGVINQTVTYTLTSDCVQTGEIVIANAVPDLEVTINGGGHRITGGGDSEDGLFRGSGILTLNNVTIDGEGKSRYYLVFSDVVNANNVTFARAYAGAALQAGEANLNNVLFVNNYSPYYALRGNGSALHAGRGAAHTLNNAVFRNNYGNGGAAVASIEATVTTTGCLTLSGNVPYDFYEVEYPWLDFAAGTWTDNSTGPCSGAIGNGDQAVIPPPAIMPCGLPAPGNLDVSATYSLTADCVITGSSTISEHVSIRIEGNGHSIRANPANRTYYIAATASLDLQNVGMSGLRLFNWGEVTGHHISMADTTSGGIVNMGEMRFTNALFEGMTTTEAEEESVLRAWNPYAKGFTRIADSTFRNNHGGLGVLQNDGGTIELIGCVMFIDNTPANYYGTVDDQSIHCNSPPVGPFFPAAPVAPIAQASALPKFENCDLRLGAIGVICRPFVQPPAAYVYRINTESEGFFKLGLSQPQVEAVENGLVACSADGRVAVRTGLPPEIRHFFEIDPKYHEELLKPRRYIIISKGPNVEGKINHVVLDNDLDGRVFGIVSTFGGLPAAECVKAASAPVAKPTVRYAAPVQPQAAQPDGSIIHVVQPGDTVSAIAVAYRVYQLDIIMLNQLENMGRWIYPRQELLIREADA